MRLAGCWGSTSRVPSWYRQWIGRNYALQAALRDNLVSYLLVVVVLPHFLSKISRWSNIWTTVRLRDYWLLRNIARGGRLPIGDCATLISRLTFRRPPKLPSTDIKTRCIIRWMELFYLRRS